MPAGWHDFGWGAGHKAWSKRHRFGVSGHQASLGAVYLGWDIFGWGAGHKAWSKRHRFGVSGHQASLGAVYLDWDISLPVLRRC